VSHLVIMFAKAPVPGKVKTRLHTHFSPEAAAELHGAFLRDQASRLLATRDGFEGWVSVAGDADHPVLAEIGALGVRCVEQPGDSLGDRMACAVEMGLAAGFEGVTLIGSDSPTLPTAHIDHVASLMKTHDVAFGASTDGGYVSVTARCPVPALREPIAWSTATTLIESMDAVGRAGLLAALAGFWYDVDHAVDVAFLRRHLDLMGPEAEVVAPCTLAWLRAHPSS
jgi:uncharacterized protein